MPKDENPVDGLVGAEDVARYIRNNIEKLFGPNVDLRNVPNKMMLLLQYKPPDQHALSKHLIFELHISLDHITLAAEFAQQLESWQFEIAHPDVFDEIAQEIRDIYERIIMRHTITHNLMDFDMVDLKKVYKIAQQYGEDNGWKEMAEQEKYNQ